MCDRCQRKRGGHLIYHCFAGLTETVMPIKIEDIVIGYAMLGQFRTQEKLPGDIIESWIQAGFDRETLEDAFQEQPFFDKIALDNMLRLFYMLVTFIVTREYVKVRPPSLSEEVLQWVENHITEPMEQDEIAAAMNRSKSSISHTVKRQFGMSFKQLCILKRIQRFESIITKDPHTSIQDAAFQVGYSDPFYFSRIYRKVRLVSPSTYVNSIRKSMSN
jgi:AraC-like DNA-binding protein